MRLHRFIGPFDLSQKNFTVTDVELLSQWRSVLRLSPHDAVILCDGHGTEAEATLLTLDRKQATLEITRTATISRGAAKSVTLLTALIRRENFELIVQKATEIGITRIVPLLTERTVKTGFNKERLEKIIREAAEQSGRTVLPTLHEPLEFATAINHCIPSESALFDVSVKKADSYKLEATSLFIGPEGGFSEAEVALAKAAGIPILSLGSLTLRAETAAIVASYLAVQ